MEVYMKKRLMSNLTTSLCKTTLSMALNSLNEDVDGCTFLLYEAKQPDSLKATDIKSLSKKIKEL
jgi:hypothetical protein